jgi:hypothetical protein
MRKTLAVSIAVVLVLSVLLIGGQAAPAQADSPMILKFGSMAGIPVSLIGTQSQIPLRGISGGGLPWVLTSANGYLKSNGALKIEVEGLVLAAGANTGSNPIPSFRGLVSCVKNDGTFENILTGNFPATTGPATSGGGNADIEAMISLPQPCIAPIIFVTSPGGAWFAATGR